MAELYCDHRYVLNGMSMSCCNTVLAGKLDHLTADGAGFAEKNGGVAAAFSGTIEYPTLVNVCSYGITDITDITVQILTDSKKNRQCDFLVTAEFCHCAGCNIQILAESNFSNFFFSQFDPQLFITNSHGTRPFAYISIALV